MDQFSLLQLIALLMVLALVVPGFIRWHKHAPQGSTLKYVAVWLAIALIAAILYRLFNG